MKIVYLGTAYPLRGGIAHYNALLFNELRSRGHDIHMISFSRQYPSIFFPGKTQKDLGEECIKVESEQMLDSIGPYSWLRVAHRVSQYKPDLIIYKFWMPFFAPCYSTVSFFSKLWCNTKVLYVCDNIIPHENTPIDTMLTRLGLAYADHFIVMSKEVRDQLLQFNSDADYRLIPHPTYNIFGDGVPKQEARQKLGLTAKNIILFFGYVRRYKGLSVILDAMPHVLQKMNATLVVAGEFYDDKEMYLRQIKKLGIEDKVAVLDQFISNEDVKYYYSAADVVTLPYISATQSGIVQIAYNYNKPVISSDVGGLPEIVDNGVTGYVVPSEQSKALADAILKYYAKNDEKKFSQNIQRKKGEYSWGKLAAAVESFIK